MVVHVHGFDWAVYTERVMPAFARWLIEKDEAAVYQLFEKTRCALEEQFLPEPMQKLRVWPRAKAFVDLLPRGPHSRKEYAKLCSAKTFTTLSDSYLHSHAPHLYQNSNAVRSVWGAIIEEYCSPWVQLVMEEALGEEEAMQTGERGQDEESVRNELVSLLQAAGLGELAEGVGEQFAEVERFEWWPEEREAFQAEESEDKGENTTEDEDDELDTPRPRGIIIGQHPNTLHLRGWLAGYSVRAMALFEYLACGRRTMPFGYEPGEPYGASIGYLTPDEVWQLATSLHSAKPPRKVEAELDFRLYNQQQKNRSDSAFRLIDEVLPAYADEFLQAVRKAALQGLGLICNVD